MTAALTPNVESDVPSRRWIAVVLVLAILLRLPFLFEFGIDDDEFYTLSNALAAFNDPLPGAVARYPLLFLATRLAIECTGLGALALRLFPFVCGVLAVALLYSRGRRVFDPRVGLAAAALLAIWPWHQYWSGMGRYYAPLFCVGVVLLDAVHRLLERFDRSLVMEIVGLAVLAMLIHPAGLLALSGVVALFLHSNYRSRLGRNRLLGVAVVIVGACLALRFSGVWASVSRVLSGEGGEGANALQLVLGLAFNVSLPILALAAIGCVDTWRTRPSLAIYLTTAGTFPVVLLFVFAALGQNVQGRYAMVAFPALLLLAGVGFVALWSRLPSAPLRSGLCVAVALASAPGLVSNLLDGDRHDVPTIADSLRSRLRHDDVLFAEGHGLVAVYLFGVDRRMPSWLGVPPFPYYFGEVPPSQAQLEALATSGRRGWFVVPENALAREDGEIGRLVRWLRMRARVVARVGVGRLDYHRNELVLLEVPARGAS